LSDVVIYSIGYCVSCRYGYWCCCWGFCRTNRRRDRWRNFFVDNGGLTIAGGLYTVNGVALNVYPDTNFVHTGTVNLNMNSSDSGSTAFSLQCGGVTRGTFGYNASTGKTYLIAYDSGGGNSQMHILGAKTVIENDTDFYGLLNVSCNNPVINLQHNGSNRVDLGFDGTNNYFRARNAGNLDIINENGSIAVTSSSGVLYTVGGLQIRPNTSNTGQIGTSGQYYFAVYSNWFYGKNSSTFGCERSKSDQEWAHEFSANLMLKNTLPMN